jgi:large subunit ribosomal protein L4
LEIDGTALLVSGEPNKNLSLASRNVPLVQLTTATDLNTYEVVRYDKLIFTRTALEKLQERLKND